MNIMLKEQEQKIEAPKVQDIVVGGKVLGDCTPSICSNRLKWHAVIHLDRVNNNVTALGPAVGLLQGHGSSPDEAIAKAVVDGRKHVASYQAALAAFEESIGVSGEPSGELAKVR